MFARVFCEQLPSKAFTKPPTHEEPGFFFVSWCLRGTFLHTLFRSHPLVILSVALGLLIPAGARANPSSGAICEQAADALYDLDRDRAIDLSKRAVAADPGDPSAHRILATTLWLDIMFPRGNMTVDDYLGPVNRSPSVPVAATAPSDVVSQFRESNARAIALARDRIAAAPNDPEGHYQLGAALGLRASFAATVDMSLFGAFRAARDAYGEHEKVMKLDAGRKDAGLIVGMYRYVVAALAMPLRWVAYVAGFSGDKDQGLRLVEDATRYPGDDEVDARLALVLLYSRERRYSDALTQLAALRERYPRNRLLWLESGSTCLRAGRAIEANRLLEDGISRFVDDKRVRMFGEEALWHHKHGLALSSIGRTQEAVQELTRALSLEGRKWVYGRSHLALAKIALKSGDRAAAREHLQSAISLCESDNDPASAEEARRLLKEGG
jgi:tetratricopeptide (TPR) repeat protein